MEHSDFTLKEVTRRFGLTIDETRDLFGHIMPVPPTDFLQVVLADSGSLALTLSNEKARSEFLIAPILLEVRRVKQQQISLFSGQEFVVEPSEGLAGVCDFLISRSPEQYIVHSPIMVVVEAKNENIKMGLGQCAAEMLAVQKFNEREQNIVPTVYGTVTPGDIWKFLQLESATLSIDTRTYYGDNLDFVLGVLLHMVS